MECRLFFSWAATKRDGSSDEEPPSILLAGKLVMRLRLPSDVQSQDQQDQSRLGAMLQEQVPGRFRGESWL